MYAAQAMWPRTVSAICKIYKTCSYHEAGALGKQDGVQDVVQGPFCESGLRIGIPTTCSFHCCAKSHETLQLHHVSARTTSMYEKTTEVALPSPAGLQYLGFRGRGIGSWICKDSCTVYFQAPFPSLIEKKQEHHDPVCPGDN